MSLLFLFGGVAVLVAGRTVAAAPFALPAALFGNPDHGHGKGHDQNQQRDNSADRQHKKDLSFCAGATHLSGHSIHHFAPKGNRKPAKTAHISGKCAPSARLCHKIQENENWGLQFLPRHGIISLFRFGGLAQLVRAPASHAGGLGFESLILHQTQGRLPEKVSGFFLYLRDF